MSNPMLRVLKWICYTVFFVPVFFFLLALSLIKGAIFSPFVFLVIAFGDAGVLIGLWPFHIVCTIYCIARTKKFGPYLRCILILLVPVPTIMWTVIGLVGTVIMGIGYAFVWPVMETFKAISREGVSIPMRFIRCFTDGTYSNIWGACTIVRDFADFSFHSYYSLMVELLEANGEKPIEIKVTQISVCIFCAAIGLLVDVPLITLVVLYKAPILLFKGWHRLVQDLIGREGPFLETVCVPFAGILILIWPIIVICTVLMGILSSFFFGLAATFVAYKERSAKKGLCYVIASVSNFDESTNDFLGLREGSCFPRPKYREDVTSSSSLLPVRDLVEQRDASCFNGPIIRTPSQKMKALNSLEIYERFFITCQHLGKVLLRNGAIGLSDLEAWQYYKNKIVNIGIPAYAFLEFILYSIKSGSPGILMSDNVELTNLNRPEGRVFDWLFQPMIVMKEQIKNLNFAETEILYLYKFCLYSGDKVRIETWQNGGFPPEDEIRRAQLEGIGRRLQGFCLMLSRLPTSRRRFFETVQEIQQGMIQQSDYFGDGDNIEKAGTVDV